MQEKSTNNILTTSIEQLSSLIKSATILGEPIIVSEKEAIIPISKISFGFGSGCADIASKIKANETIIYEDNKLPCAGGIIGGVAVIPEAILYLYNGKCEIITIKKEHSTLDKMTDIVLEFIHNIKKKGQKKTNLS